MRELSSFRDYCLNGPVAQSTLVFFHFADTSCSTAIATREGKWRVSTPLAGYHYLAHHCRQQDDSIGDNEDQVIQHPAVDDESDRGRDLPTVSAAKKLQVNQ